MRSPDENLQLLLDRYSMMGPASNPSGIDVRNADTRYMATFSPRSGYLYGELTRHGLVHVHADADKTQHNRLQTLVIDHSFVTVRDTTYDRRAGWSEHMGTSTSYSVPLIHGELSMRLATHPQMIDGKYGEEREGVERVYARVIQALGLFAVAERKNDALHQLSVQHYPEQPENLAQLYPYAGEAYGPRVNLEDMIRQGMTLHPAVAEALARLPKMSETD